MASVKTLQVSDADFQNTVVESDQPVLVDFWAAWCGPCRALAPTIDELAETFDGRAKVVKLDVDANPHTAQAYGIGSIPTVLLFREGQVVQSFVGVQPKERYERAIEQHAA